MDNNYRLYVALNVLNRLMSSFIENRLREIYGENWWAEGVDKVVFQSSEPSGINSPQILAIEHYRPIIEYHWHKCFVDTFGDIDKVTGQLNDIGDMHGRIAPGYPSLSDNDTRRYLDTMESLAVGIDAAYAGEISRLKNDIEDMQKTESRYIDIKKITDEPRCDTVDDIEKLLLARETIEKKIQEIYYRCITVMFTDLQNSTGIANKEGDIIARLVIKKHDDIVLPLIKATGTLVKTIGDGTLSYFSGADNALAAAIRIQKDLKHFNNETQFKPPLRIRIGLHTGECIVENNDIKGSVVNIASRFESISNPGEIYLSQNTYNALSSEKKKLCRYLRDAALKGIVDETFRVYGVIRDGWEKETIAGANDQSSLQSTEEKEDTTVTVSLPSLRLKDNPEVILYIKSEEVLIGRLSECNLRLEDPCISRRHAMVYFSRNNYFIQDLNSKLGVFVNGRKVSEQRLHSGDVILIGKQAIIFTNPAQESNGFTDTDPAIGNIGKTSGRFLLIKITASGEAKERYPLTPDGVTIGRDGENSAIRLDDSSVSKKHARIWLEKEKVYVEDLNSRNGTFVGDKMIPAGKAIELPTGKIIKIGNSQFMVFDTDTTMDSDAC
ncbi:MAG: FHA domain-containing protein [Nitrospirae bacterium]|nr:FHA domain-containing protein [Nitrospirota bacterium]